MTSAELTGWLAYLQVDDEVKTQRTSYAIARAFNGDKKQPAKRKDEEEVIDTTDPEFVKYFRGFTHSKPQQRRPNRQTSTEIKIG
jgi:hypothetical protein